MINFLIGALAGDKSHKVYSIITLPLLLTFCTSQRRKWSDENIELYCLAHSTDYSMTDDQILILQLLCPFPYLERIIVHVDIKSYKSHNQKSSLFMELGRY